MELKLKTNFCSLSISFTIQLRNQLRIQLRNQLRIQLRNRKQIAQANC